MALLNLRFKMFLSFLNRLRTSTQWLGPVCVFTKSVLAMFEKLRYLKSVLPPEARYGIDPVWRLPDGVNHFSHQIVYSLLLPNRS